jgi:hypothetical protein
MLAGDVFINDCIETSLVHAMGGEISVVLGIDAAQSSEKPRRAAF